MQPGLAEVARDVDADPTAVLEAQGAESVDELVAEAGEAERDAGSDRAVTRLFEGDLDRPERRPTPDCDAARGTEPDEPATTPAVLADLDGAIEASDDAAPDELAEVDLGSLNDADVAAALAAAEEREASGAAPSVPAEWTEE